MSVKQSECGSSRGGSEPADVRALAIDGANSVPVPAVAPSPRLHVLERDNLAWVDAMGLIATADRRQRFASIRSGACAAYTYPRATADIQLLGANLISWLFLCDDDYGEWTGELAAQADAFRTFEQVLFDAALPAQATPYHHALSDLCDRLREAASAHTYRRFGYSMRRYFDGCVMEFPYRNGGRSPSLSVYRSIRRWSVGVLAVLDLVELIADPPPGPDVMERARVWEFRDRAALMCAWTNDLYSFDKETRANDPLNFVAVLMTERQLSCEAAFDDAVAIYRRDLAAFQRDVESWLQESSIDPGERAYVTGVCEWVHGSHHWAQLSPRYGASSLATDHPEGDASGL